MNTLFNKVFGGCDMEVLDNVQFMRYYRCATDKVLMGDPIKGSNIIRPPLSSIVADEIKDRFNDHWQKFKKWIGITNYFGRDKWY